MASCAVCLLPIARGDRFLLEGTEVFHVPCVRNSYRSKLTLTEAKLRETEAQLADTRRAAARTESELNIQRNIATSSQADVVQITAVAQRASRRAADAEAAQFEVERQLESAHREIAALKADLAARSSENKQEADPAQDDASVIRFKLLELT